jgi:hypothetical protein
MMDEKRLMDVFARMRKRAAVPVPPYEHPGMLTIARARSLVLNPALWTEEERRHVTECRRCARLVSRVGEDMYHPPWWLLERKLEGRLSAEEAKSLQYHLEQGQCQRCAGRVQALEAASKRVVRPRQAIRLRKPQEGVNTPLASEDGVLTAEVITHQEQVFPYREKVFLEVRSKEPTLSYQLVGYAFQDASERETTAGFLVLRPDVNDWQTADVSFVLEELVARVQGECRNLVICPLDPSLLVEEDREALLAAVERDADAPDGRRAAWQAWLDPNSTLVGNARPLLDEVRARLQR